MFNVPNLITVANLLTGCLGIMAVINHGPQSAFYYVALAVFFDFFDGFFARKLNQFSAMGKELDSLADMVSFGVLPGFAMFYFMEGFATWEYLPYAALSLVAFSALRLAKFNVDERQSDTFYGLPTPSNAMFFVSLPFLNYPWIQNQYVLLVLIAMFSFFLVSEIKMFALKFKTFGIRDNKLKYMAMVLALAAIVLLGIKGIPLVIMMYILFSVFNGMNAAKNR